MAQLNDLLVLGKSALLGDVQFRYLKAPISSGSATLGPGTAGQVLRTNGTTVYWGAEGQGPTGATGLKGATGSQGVQGATGLKGATGSQGVQGATGSQGVQGATGLKGATGTAGAKGATGSQGVQGATGSQGVQGATGTAGAKGATGATGPKGATGAAGSYTEGSGITISSSTIKMTVPHSVVASTSTSTPASGAIIWYYT